MPSDKTMVTALPGMFSGTALSGKIPRRLLTVAEAADELRCSKAHIHHLIAGTVRGVPILPSIQLGRRRLILRASFDAWLRTAERTAD
jgi:excisionase family DNA binding protein